MDKNGTPPTERGADSETTNSKLASLTGETSSLTPTKALKPKRQKQYIKTGRLQGKADCGTTALGRADGFWYVRCKD